jgi:hypothetical protein
VLDGQFRQRQEQSKLVGCLKFAFVEQALDVLQKLNLGFGRRQALASEASTLSIELRARGGGEA